MGNRSLIILVRLFCVIEVLALGPLAFPYLNLLHIGVLDSINQIMGGTALPPIDRLHVVLAGIAGSLSLAFVIIRWRTPTRAIVTVEGVLRITVGGWLLYAGIVLNAPLLLVFAALDMVGGALHLSFARRT